MNDFGLNRKLTDKFYTKSTIVEDCLNSFKNNIKINDDDICIEPSAGNGSFIHGIKNMFTNYKFYDIEPENDEIKKEDFLKINFENKKYNRVHIIGNPPFGRQSSLAIKFIKKSSEFCDTISFILPKSFKKDSLRKHFPLNFHLIFEKDLPKNSFSINGKEHDVPCVYQIWIKKINNREIKKKEIPKSYKFVKKTEPHDISFRRVGVNAGKIDKITTEKSIQSHYFIKFDKEISDKLIDKLSDILFSCKENTAGPRSISKQELIKEFNSILN